MSNPLYFDCDVTPPLRSRYARRRRIDAAKEEAMRLLEENDAEGQIGLFEHSSGGEFYGYVIRYPGQPAYFESPQKENDE